jgi:hypothetical protein
MQWRGENVRCSGPNSGPEDAQAWRLPSGNEMHALITRWQNNGQMFCVKNFDIFDCQCRNSLWHMRH